VIDQASNLHDEIYGLIRGLVLGGVSRPAPGTKIDGLMEQIFSIDRTLEEVKELAQKRLKLKQPGDVESLTISVTSLGGRLSRLFLDVYELTQQQRIVSSAPKGRPEPAVALSDPGRNDPCPCGSGEKFKHCHGAGGKLMVH
jgi:uncharacterized protein YecA (UPF0149 family)